MDVCSTSNRFEFRNYFVDCTGYRMYIRGEIQQSCCYSMSKQIKFNIMAASCRLPRTDVGRGNWNIHTLLEVLEVLSNLNFMNLKSKYLRKSSAAHCPVPQLVDPNDCSKSTAEVFTNFCTLSAGPSFRNRFQVSILNVHSMAKWIFDRVKCNSGWVLLCVWRTIRRFTHSVALPSKNSFQGVIRRGYKLQSWG